jgi:hypothetical protein
MNSNQKSAVHLIQMHVTGWQGCDFDQLTAVSGSSALFGHQPGEFTAKNAHLTIGIDQRIAEPTGFGYKWINFNNISEAWEIITAGIEVLRHTQEMIKDWRM